ncbi:hypothetical protein OsI_35775 [Oryza sativa Indica Group]|jgi:hypothetical protein|uniref:Uncharacterized protein n=1 Tax=Oryza sativa subsp. indica TaxID=39946 RepID=B8BK07_ORYSI|nr:hypothetical protein OsI_35775 [Oryza sativa Indica Group]
MADFGLHAEVGPPMDGEMVHHKVPYPTGYEGGPVPRLLVYAMKLHRPPVQAIHVLRLALDWLGALPGELPAKGAPAREFTE